MSTFQFGCDSISHADCSYATSSCKGPCVDSTDLGVPYNSRIAGRSIHYRCRGDEPGCLSLARCIASGRRLPDITPGIYDRYSLREAGMGASDFPDRYIRTSWNLFADADARWL